MDGFRLPAALDFSTSNLADAWSRWRQSFQNYLVASERNAKPEETKIAIFLNCIGDEGVSVFNSFTFDPVKVKEADGTERLIPVRVKLEDVLKRFSDHCSPRKNVVYERSIFFRCFQKDGQSIDSYVTELKNLASSCEFGDQRESLIRDRVVLGIRDAAMTERLLREPDLSLSKATDFIRTAEISRLQMRNMMSSTGAHVNSVSRVRHNEKPPDSNRCRSCGRRHLRGECPASGRTCFRCNAVGHFASVCRAGRFTGAQAREVREISVSDRNIDATDEVPLYIDALDSVVSSNNEWTKMITVFVGKTEYQVRFKLDTGANANILPINTFSNSISKLQMKNTSVVLMTYGNFKIKPLGVATLKCSVEGFSDISLDFFIVNTDSKPILGLNACQKLNLIKRVCEVTGDFKSGILESYQDVFTGLGRFPDSLYHIELRPNSVGVIHPPRRVPQVIRGKLKETLEDLEKRGVIEKVGHPTDWVQSLVIVEKPNGSLRLCLDPRDLNKVIKREHHLIPSTEDIISELEGKSFFSVVDLKDGFWQICLDDQSSEICTFNTPFGRYKFKRMPFGIASAPEVFQKRNEKMFGDIQGVHVYFDDLIITGSSEADHDDALRKVLDRARSCNVKFNPEKFQCKKREVRFMGHIISDSGIKADPGHLKGIADMPVPTTKSEVRRLLGMINFLSKFIPNASKLTAPLRELVKDKTEFLWGSEQSDAFYAIKSALLAPPVLRVFSGSRDVVIQCDSSKDGLGSCLMQDGQPVSFVSRSLTNAEKNYAQIEKELLAIVFSCEKFHNYIYGRKVTVQSDHRPLVSIINKPMSKISSRLQKMVLKLLKYNLEITYVPGNQMFIADTLSRSFNVSAHVKDDLEMLNMVHNVVKYVPMSDKRKSEFVNETKNDVDLSLVCRYLREGFPALNKIPSGTRHFYKIKDSLYMNEGLLFYNDKIVVPRSLRKSMLELIHEAHFGITKCKQRAREILYWPGMSSDIENVVSQCEICEKFRSSNCKQPLMPHPVPDRPFQRVAADIMDFGGRSYLCLMDYYSKWIEVYQINTKSANEVICKLKDVFSRFGVVDELVSDNIPFNSFVFREFSSEWNFNCVFVSPRFPQSNGLAERCVGIVKMIFRKALEEGKDYRVSLMEYRNTPIAGLDLSPSQLMFNRRLKTKLPISGNLLNPEIFLDVKNRLENRQNVQKYHYDRTAKSLRSLGVGDTVGIRDFGNRAWERGRIVDLAANPRSFKVQNRAGGILVRNRRHLIPSRSKFSLGVDYDQQTLKQCSDTDSTSGALSPQDLSPARVPDVSGTRESPGPYRTRYGRVIREPERYGV